MADSCVFCKIVRREIPASIVRESESCLSFHDIRPQAPVHIVLVPKRHVATPQELGEGDRALLSDLFLEANRITREKGLAEAGYRLVVNCRADGGQTVSHLHMHILGGRSMKWPPG